MRSGASAAHGASVGTASSGEKLTSPSRAFCLRRCRRVISSHPLRGKHAGAHDVLIGAAAADVAAYRTTHLVFGGRMRSAQQAGDAHDLPGGAEPALEGV